MGASLAFFRGFVGVRPQVSCIKLYLCSGPKIESCYRSCATRKWFVSIACIMSTLQLDFITRSTSSLIEHQHIGEWRPPGCNMIHHSRYEYACWSLHVHHVVYYYVQPHSRLEISHVRPAVVGGLSRGNGGYSSILIGSHRTLRLVACGQIKQQCVQFKCSNVSKLKPQLKLQ